jgi:hypothetical protein
VGVGDSGSNIARLVVAPIAYPGLGTARGVVTAIALDASGQSLIKVPMKGWTPLQITQFIAACDTPSVVQVAETLTPQQAITRWPGSFSPFSHWRGYVVLVATLAFLGVPKLVSRLPYALSSFYSPVRLTP